MQKYTYPIVFIYNEETGYYNGYIPDLHLSAVGEKLEDAYADAEDAMTKYFQIVLEDQLDVEPPSTLEKIAAKWVGFKTSLISVDLTPAKKKR